MKLLLRYSGLTYFTTDSDQYVISALYCQSLQIKLTQNKYLFHNITQLLYQLNTALKDVYVENVFVIKYNRIEFISVKENYSSIQ